MADDQGPFMPPGSLPTQQQGPVQDTPPPQTTPDNVGGNIPQQASPQAPIVAVQQSPQQKNLLHSAALGQGWKSIMGTLGGAGGAQNFFKGLLTSAIVGAAAGANNNTGSGLKSAAMGAGAALEDQRAQQQLAQQRQQQQFQNQMSMTKEGREKQLQDAQLAQMQAQTVRWRHEDDLHDQEAHDKHNAAAQVLVNSYTDPKVGGKDPVDAALPGTISATDLTQKYMTNPKVRTSTDPNYLRHFIDTTDSSEVTWNPEANKGTGGWVNQTSGEPENMTDHTMFRVIDVPRDTMATRVPTKGSDLNTLEQLPKGQKIYDDDAMYPVSALDKGELFKRGQDRRLEQSKVDVERRRIGASETANQRERDRQIQEQFSSFQRTVSEENNNLREQLKEEIDPDKQASIKQQIAINDAGLVAKQEELYPSRNKKPTTSTPPPNKQPVEDPIVNKALGLVSHLPVFNQKAQITASTSLTPEQKKTALANIEARPKGWTPQDIPGFVGNVLKTAVQSNIP